MTTANTSNNGDAELVEPGVFLSSGAAQKKFGLSNSVLYAWRDRGLVHYEQGRGFAETDIFKVMSDPKRSTKFKGKIPGRGRKLKTAAQVRPPRIAKTAGLISGSEAARKYDISPSTIFSWANRGFIRKAPNGFYIEAEIATRAADPTFRAYSRARKAGHVNRKKPSMIPKRRRVETQAQAPAAGPDLAHHV